MKKKQLKFTCVAILTGDKKPLNDYCEKTGLKQFAVLSQLIASLSTVGEK